jgi:hypothetical protein
MRKQYCTPALNCAAVTPCGIGAPGANLIRTLRAMAVQSALEQGFISRPVAVEELFARNTQSLTA